MLLQSFYARLVWLTNVVTVLAISLPMGETARIIHQRIPDTVIMSKETANLSLDRHKENRVLTCLDNPRYVFPLPTHQFFSPLTQDALWGVWITVFPYWDNHTIDLCNPCLEIGFHCFLQYDNSLEITGIRLIDFFDVVFPCPSDVFPTVSLAEMLAHISVVINPKEFSVTMIQEDKMRYRVYQSSPSDFDILSLFKGWEVPGTLNIILLGLICYLIIIWFTRS